MGNSNSITKDTFENQLISTILWSLRQNEIINHYKNKYNILNIPYTPTYDISKLYRPEILKPEFITTLRSSKIPIPLIENYPDLLYASMIQEYLDHILENKEEVNGLIQQTINKLTDNETSNHCN